MIQGFEWYARKDEQHWKRLNGQLEKLSDIGVDMIWIPPASKAAANPSTGYDVYGKLSVALKCLSMLMFPRPVGSRRI